MIYILKRRLLPNGVQYHDTEYHVVSHHKVITQDIINSIGLTEARINVSCVNSVRWSECWLDSEHGRKFQETVAIFNDSIPLVSTNNQQTEIDSRMVKAISEYKVLIREEKLDLILG